MRQEELCEKERKKGGELRKQKRRMKLKVVTIRGGRDREREITEKRLTIEIKRQICGDKGTRKWKKKIYLDITSKTY